MNRVQTSVSALKSFFLRIAQHPSTSPNWFRINCESLNRYLPHLQFGQLLLFLQLFLLTLGQFALEGHRLFWCLTQVLSIVEITQLQHKSRSQIQTSTPFWHFSAPLCTFGETSTASAADNSGKFGPFSHLASAMISRFMLFDSSWHLSARHCTELVPRWPQPIPKLILTKLVLTLVLTWWLLSRKRPSLSSLPQLSCTYSGRSPSSSFRSSAMTQVQHEATS